MDNEFTEYHKDSFVRAEADGKKKPAVAKKQPPPGPLPGAGGEADKLDDFVPEKVGKVVDNVFGKLDNLVNDAADYLFGGKKKGGGLLDGDTFDKQKSPTQIPPLQPQPQQPTVLSPQSQQAPKPSTQVESPPKSPKPAQKTAAPKSRPAPVQTLSTLQGSRAPEMIRPVMPEAKPKYDGPVISRTTSISELDLPLEILDDPDLPKYFDQMKLYEAKVVEAGLCNLPQFEATHALRKGKWKQAFKIKFEDLKHLQPGIYPVEMAKSRFHGMRPVYKAMAHKFSSDESLKKAIEEDINAYLKGKESKQFHSFIYQVVSTLIR